MLWKIGNFFGGSKWFVKMGYIIFQCAFKEYINLKLTEVKLFCLNSVLTLDLT